MRHKMIVVDVSHNNSLSPENMMPEPDNTFTGQDHIKSAHTIASASIIAMLAAAFLLGGAVTHFAKHRLQQPAALTALSFSIPLALLYCWYYYDSIEHVYIRSRALNLGIILLAIVFLPYYLLRSRPKGRRLKAIWRMLGIAFGYLLMEMLGALLVRVVAVL